jgi:hypothetical protein
LAIINLPYQDKIDRTSGPKVEGFGINEISYSSKVFQRSFSGADAESSREEVWTIKWMHLQYSTPSEVAAGAIDELGAIRSFYKSAYMNRVLWKPFELADERIWSIVPNTLKVENPAGCVFNASLDLKYLYDNL